MYVENQISKSLWVLILVKYKSMSMAGTKICVSNGVIVAVDPQTGSPGPVILLFQHLW